ncbi:MAG: discoidin domain-containing protein [Candidatus Omnitrophota bacterium]
MNNFFLLSLLFIFGTIGAVSCAQDSGLVYLKVDSVSVSSFDVSPDWAPPHNPKATVDGDKFTRWSSDYKENQWISFDFGSPKVLSKIILIWEAAYAADYDILISDDNQNWKAFKSFKNMGGGTQGINFAPVKTRFVKILGVRKATEFGISLWETLFFGPAEDNPQDKPLAEVYPQLAGQLSGKQTTVMGTEAEEPLPSPGALTLEELQKGVVYTSWGTTELSEPASDGTLEFLSKLGVKHLAIMIVWFQDTNEEKAVYADPKDTLEDKALIHAINKAHSLGMKVMLKPHVDIKTGQARIDIIPSQEWFASYKDYLLHYAKLASLYNVEIFSIGTELLNTTTPSWQSMWEDIIKDVTGVFSGPLVYDANWDEYQTVGFWDKLDFIGIDAYFPLTAKNDPTKEELIIAWQNNASQIDRWLKERQLNKPVIFTEAGYCSADGTNIQPWSDLSKLSEEAVDEQEQADSLEALLTVCPAFPWFKGFYLWNYFPQERWSPLGYPVRGKKAEKVFSSWLNKL